MKKFTIKLILFISFNFLLYVVIIIFFYGNISGSNCDVPFNQKYDLVIMGTSHGQVFYNRLTENILSKKIRNISTGSAGVVPEKILLSCFFHAKNKTKQIVYFFDPWALFNTRWNENNYILGQEGISFPYFIELLKNHVGKKVVFDYFKEKILDQIEKKERGIFVIPPDKTSQAAIISSTKENSPQITQEEQKIIDKRTDGERIGVLFSEGLNKDNFARYSEILKSLILLAKNHNAKIIFIIPPTLMGHFPGHDQTLALLAKYEKLLGTKYYDLSNELQNQKYYSDREHLNDDGVTYFTKEFLINILK